MEEKEVPTLPRLNEPAPDFTAKTTLGEIRLSDFKGKWVVLFSHPADFTPVCSTEFLAFARRKKAFEELGVQLIGLSIDSIHAHLAWVKDLEEMSGIAIDFPVIADLDMKVSRLYGMIHPAASETAAVPSPGRGMDHKERRRVALGEARPSRGPEAGLELDEAPGLRPPPPPPSAPG
jgi:peroxiredoxin (alkyl hydroperoxide reductase subunit C)